jgi:hypothetical protein
VRAWFQGFLRKTAFFFLVFAWSKRGELLAKHGQKYVVARQGRKIPSVSQPDGDAGGLSALAPFF